MAELAADRRCFLHPALSTYFDILRIGAATVVLLSHCAPMLFGTPTWFFPGHDAVMLFFVLSGYVIAYSADGRDGAPETYAVSRLSRLWSVSIPALLFAAIVAALSKKHPIVLPALLNVPFMAEWWTGEYYAPSDIPMWSLNYEAWYYLIFAVWLFSFVRWRACAVAMICVVAGFRVMLLLPIWAAGAALYYKRPTVPRSVAYFLLALSVAGYGITYKIGLKYMLQDWLQSVTHGEYYHLMQSTAFLSDFVVGALVVMNFIAVDNLTRGLHVPQPIRQASTYAASFTLAVYLFHVPVTILLSTVLHAPPIISMTLLFPALFALGLITEHQRKRWRAGIEGVIHRIRGQHSGPVLE